MFRLFEKLFAFLVVAPPVYMAFRYLRWYSKDKRSTEHVHAEEA